MTDPEFDAYYRRHVMRHRDPRNRWAVFIGDNLVLASVLLLLRGRLRRARRVYMLGVTTTVLGHFLFDHNLGEELRAIRQDPRQSLRAEGRFLEGLWTKGPSAFDPVID